MSEPGFWVGSWRNVAIQIWGSETTVARLDQCSDCHRRVLLRHPGKLVTFAIIMPGVPPRLGDGERKRIRQMSEEQRSSTVAAVQVVEGSGFWASAVRAVLTGLGMFSVTRNKVFDGVADAVAWVMATTFVDAPAKEFLAAVYDARQRFTNAAVG